MKHVSRLIILPVLAVGLSACPQSAEQSTEQASPAATETSAAPTSEATTASSAAALKGDPTKGPALLASKTCGTCHTVKGVTGAVGTIGPSLDGIATTAATRVAGLDAEAYLRQSIEQPQAFVVPKFQPVMPALRPNLSDQEYADLIAYLMTLKS